MLRALVGDSAFFRGLRSYYLANRHSTALTDDLRRAVEATSGRPLGWFFDQWLRRPGFAEVTTSWRYDAAQRRVVATIAQGTPLWRVSISADRRDHRRIRQGATRDDRRAGHFDEHADSCRST